MDPFNNVLNVSKKISVQMQRPFYNCMGAKFNYIFKLVKSNEWF